MTCQWSDKLTSFNSKSMSRICHEHAVSDMSIDTLSILSFIPLRLLFCSTSNSVKLIFTIQYESSGMSDSVIQRET